MVLFALLTVTILLEYFQCSFMISLVNIEKEIVEKSLKLLLCLRIENVTSLFTIYIS